MEAFVGKWKLEKSEKFEEFMQELNVDVVLRKAGALATPVKTITLEDGTMSIKTKTTFKNVEISFKEGEEFDEKTPDGRTVKTTINLEDGKLVQVQPGPPADVHITHEIKDDKYVMTLVVNAVTCIRVYKRCGK